MAPFPASQPAFVTPPALCFTEVVGIMQVGGSADLLRNFVDEICFHASCACRNAFLRYRYRFLGSIFLKSNVDNNVQVH